MFAGGEVEAGIAAERAGAEDAVQRVTLVYDGSTGNTKGRLKDVHYGYGFSESFTYTNAGLPLTKSLAWPSTSGAGFLTLAAEYDNEGLRTSLRYPAHYTLVNGVFTANQGRKLIYGFDAAGRLGSVNQETGGALVSAINYNAASQVTSWTRAWGGNPNAAETFTYNDAGQLTRQTLADPVTLVDVEYRYFANNDGRLWQRKNWVSGEEVTYQYDQLGRLSAALTTAPAPAGWGLSWTYDGFGNRLQQAVTKGLAPVHSVAVDPATNRMAGQSYDANGNMLIAGLVYDVENRMMTDGVWWYRYSWSNQRAVVLSAAETYAWFHGFGGELLGVYKLEKENGDANRTWPVLQTEKERVYALGRLMRMGSGDVAVDRGASVVRHGGQNLAYYPYGEEQVTSANDRAKYATYTRDATTELDYAWNRMYKVEWGRFTTADPWTSLRRMTQPEGWNRFAYGGNDPVNWHDPPGLEQMPVPGGTTDTGVTFKVTVTSAAPISGSTVPSGGGSTGPAGFGGAFMGESTRNVEMVDIGERNPDPGGGADWQETETTEGWEDPEDKTFEDRHKAAVDKCWNTSVQENEAPLRVLGVSAVAVAPLIPKIAVPPHKNIGSPVVTGMSVLGHVWPIIMTQQVAGTMNLFRAVGRLAAPLWVTLASTTAINIAFDWSDCYKFEMTHRFPGQP